MPASFENMQRGAAASERAGSGFNPGARAGGRNNQSEDRDALGAFTRRRLLRKCGTPQDAVRKMKVAEPIDIELLQAERLQDFFAFHCRRPIHKVMEVSGHNWRVPYSKLFLRVDLESQLRTQRKINGWEMTRAPTPGAIRGGPVMHPLRPGDQRLAFDEREFGVVVLAAATRHAGLRDERHRSRERTRRRARKHI